MTGLLVSVRDADEAREALAGGVDVIDVKEPLHGSLGAAAPSVWRQVRKVVGKCAPISAALGELDEWEAAAHCADLRGFQYAKLGFAGCADESRWVADWRRALYQLPRELMRVAVAYADSKAARAPSIDRVILRGTELGCRALLVDTYEKQGGNLFQHLNYNALEQAVRLARRCFMQVVLAGSLSMETVPLAMTLKPDLIAVRGAACRGGRTSRVDASLVRCVRETISSCKSSNPQPVG